MMKVVLRKIEELPDALHPNNIDVGYTKDEYFVEEPKVDECFWVGDLYRTSLVTEIIDKHTFKTCNSIYQWEKIND